MSKVKRYVVTYDGGFVTWEYREAVESDKGENIWIMESDYDALAAENERLRKAGDELYKWAGAENRPPQQVYAAWLAAKEGGAK